MPVVVSFEMNSLDVTFNHSAESFMQLTGEEHTHTAESCKALYQEKLWGLV